MPESNNEINAHIFKNIHMSLHIKRSKKFLVGSIFYDFFFLIFSKNVSAAFKHTDFIALCTLQIIFQN